ncbi:5-(carboxyamino)imidazole ribonucleotide synthase [Luteipulveratus flavus]|uniref:N5-carboxyaminoimidazole ribonucleotide synthase n=1 Tax=Luteipulveratus flavus TaxID=3031728 RepID=A0ABT6C2L2_9MICO|nr:5-(carboxyamino)imidazole ribonucleotide synthase [Luteipulveratus sp. YIM 133296]MDF8262988.1 5-(carboxyamino)imidazole ribonucleotide synthase [Luteipulveratus sp. YIM 133296]
MNEPAPAPRPRRAPGGFPVVGVIGGGQLARMMQPPAVNLGVTLSVLAESEDASAALVVPAAPVGEHTDVEAVRAFARECDVVTFDHEHVPAHVLAALQEDGIPLHPSPEALVHAQDKLAMRRLLSAIGVPCPAWAPVHDEAGLQAFGDEHGWPVVVKTPRGGYDGKGVRVVRTAAEAADWLERAADTAGLLAEEAVPFTRELAVLVARSPSGQAAVWPVVETVQTDGICTEVLAPAPDLPADLAAEVTEAALRIAGELGVTGVMAVELFQVGATFVVNELAMRPHNSGHWTIDGAVTSQFEQHLRAVLDLPLGAVTARAPWTVMGNVLGGDYPELYPAYRHILARDPELKVHLYGKGVRPGRKIGHVNVSGVDLDDLRDRAQHAAGYLQGAITE